jgi:hypothetical protein
VGLKFPFLLVVKSPKRFLLVAALVEEGKALLL